MIPSSLAITYYATPENRVALRDYMIHSGLQQFESGRAKDYSAPFDCSFSSYLDTDRPTMIVLLEFANPTSAKGCTTIENSNPGGLSREGLGLITSAQTAQMDHIFHGGLPSSPRREESVYMIIPYEFYVLAPNTRNISKITECRSSKAG